MDNTLISRGKCTKAVNVSRYITGDWVQGYYVCLNKTTHRIYTGFADTKPEICPEYLEIDPKTLGSCAGFTDKKGGLVFEGDIIKLDEECCGVDTFVVKYGVFRSIDEDVDAFALGFYAEYIGNIKKLYDRTSLTLPLDDNGTYFEVIGNIYDTADLLKERSD